MPQTEILWTDYGSGTSLQVWAVETSGYDNLEVKQYKIDHDVSFPFFSTMNDFGNKFLTDSFPISYTPWYYVICPDKLVRHIEKENIRAYVDACGVQSVESYDSNCILAYYSNKKIYFWGIEAVCSLSVYAVAGPKMFEKNIVVSKSKQQLNLDLNPGVYIIKIKTKLETKYVGKIIVN